MPFDSAKRASEILYALLRNPHTDLAKAFSALERALPNESEAA